MPLVLFLHECVRGWACGSVRECVCVCVRGLVGWSRSNGGLAATGLLLYSLLRLLLLLLRPPQLRRENEEGGGVPPDLMKDAVQPPPSDEIEDEEKAFEEWKIRELQRLKDGQAEAEERKKFVRTHAPHMIHQLPPTPHPLIYILAHTRVYVCVQVHRHCMCMGCVYGMGSCGHVAMLYVCYVIPMLQMLPMHAPVDTWYTHSSTRTLSRSRSHAHTLTRSHTHTLTHSHAHPLTPPLSNTRMDAYGRHTDSFGHSNARLTD
eukprot:GHVU01149522.1.p1 GENE.GHVU01149522.1~~GHVU01149522.1.p1  ORF type:complete len:262 (-),score=25.41 GHVU01149522.1:203-988(-)